MAQHVQQTKSLVALPKAELHIHLEGAMRYETLVDLCKKHGLEAPPDTRGKRFADFGNFVSTYVAACECLRDESDLFRLVLEVAQDAAASGARWTEPALSVGVYAERYGGIVPALTILTRAAEAAETASGVGIGFIVACERHSPVAEAEALATIVKEQASKLRIHGRPAIVGFGLHGSEAGFPPEPFATAFGIACEGTGVVALPHAGEIAPAPGRGADSVLACLTLLKAHRIGHGVLAMESQPVLDQLAASKTCLDICVTSNHLLSVVPSIAAHPLPALLHLNIPCSISTDDPLLFGSSLLLEYQLCRSELNLDDEALAACASSSFRHSLAPSALVEQGITDVAAWLDAS